MLNYGKVTLKNSKIIDVTAVNYESEMKKTVKKSRRSSLKKILTNVQNTQYSSTCFWPFKR